MKDGQMVTVLKRVSILFGFMVLAISTFFSYDGFDTAVTGSNERYDVLARTLGIVLALLVTLIQFVFSTDYKNLNMTLKMVGLVSYAYSIYTNYMGIEHVMQADTILAVVGSVFIDVVPEPLIAWSLGEALKGDFIGNLAQMFGIQPNQPNQSNQSNQQKPRYVEPERHVQKSQYKPKHKPHFGPLPNGVSRGFQGLEKKEKNEPVQGQF